MSRTKLCSSGLLWLKAALDSIIHDLHDAKEYGSILTVAPVDFDQIEYSAEVAMEHHLGLTCDPVEGLVQIPCIERNAVAAMRAINAVSLANFLTNSRQISFDAVVETMYQTGKDINVRYRETSGGGLAKNYRHSRLRHTKRLKRK